eukprot:s2005_g12.t4
MRLRPSPNENELELQSQRCYVRELDFEVRNCYNMPRMMAELLQHGHSIKCAVFEVNCLTSPLRELLSPLLHLWPVPSMHRLHMILEELQSFAWNRRRQKAFPEAEHLSASIAEVPGTQFVDDSGKDHKIASASDTASPAFAPCTAEVEVQAELEFSDSLQALRRRALMQEIDDIRIEKALVERRAARELKDLEALVLNLDRQLQSRRAESTKVAKQEAAEAEPWRGIFCWHQFHSDHYDYDYDDVFTVLSVLIAITSNVFRQLRRIRLESDTPHKGSGACAEVRQVLAMQFPEKLSA